MGSPEGTFAGKPGDTTGENDEHIEKRSSAKKIDEDIEDADKLNPLVISSDVPTKPDVIDIKNYLPTECSQQDMAQATALYVTTYQIPKKEILHDGPPLRPGQIRTIYGWGFPPVASVQHELLSFCSEQPKKGRLIDIGPGYGQDAIAMLLTRKVHLTTYEKQEKQNEEFKRQVGELFLRSYPEFPLEKNFTPLNKDFLSVTFGKQSEGQYCGINANKLLHFLSPQETDVFVTSAAFLLKPGGRLFITTVTPTVGSKIEGFIIARAENREEHPGYLFYVQQNQLFDTETLAFGPAEIILMRGPMKEKPAHYCQVLDKTDMTFTTARVMYFHTEASLQSALGSKFKIIKSMVLIPDEIHSDAQESMISIVAERLDL